MTKNEKELIKSAREDMDDNPVSQAAFKIQTIIEELYQKGIQVGESIGAAKVAFELQRQMDDVTQSKKTCKKTTKKGDK